MFRSFDFLQVFFFASIAFSAMHRRRVVCVQSGYLIETLKLQRGLSNVFACASGHRANKTYQKKHRPTLRFVCFSRRATRALSGSCHLLTPSPRCRALTRPDATAGALSPKAEWTAGRVRAVPASCVCFFFAGDTMRPVNRELQSNGSTPRVAQSYERHHHERPLLTSLK